MFILKLLGEHQKAYLDIGASVHLGTSSIENMGHAVIIGLQLLLTTVYVIDFQRRAAMARLTCFVN